MAPKGKKNQKQDNEESIDDVINELLKFIESSSNDIKLISEEIDIAKIDLDKLYSIKNGIYIPNENMVENISKQIEEPKAEPKKRGRKKKEIPVINIEEPKAEPKKRGRKKKEVQVETLDNFILSKNNSILDQDIVQKVIEDVKKIEAECSKQEEIKEENIQRKRITTRILN